MGPVIRKAQGLQHAHHLTQISLELADANIVVIVVVVVAAAAAVVESAVAVAAVGQGRHTTSQHNSGILPKQRKDLRFQNLFQVQAAYLAVQYPSGHKAVVFASIRHRQKSCEYLLHFFC